MADPTSMEIKKEDIYILSLEEVNTPEELLAVFKCMQTVFTIVKDTEVWHSLQEAGMGHLLKPQVP